MKFEYALYPLTLFLQTDLEDFNDPRRLLIKMYSIYGSALPPDQWASHWKKMIKISSDLYNDNVCNDAVSPSYAIRNLKNVHEFVNNFVMIVSDDDGVRKGVLQANISQYGAYIDVVCARRGFGSALIKHFLQYFDGIFPNNYVKLSAMPNVLTFYQQFGFEFRKSCDEPPIRPFFDDYIQQLKEGKIKNEQDSYENDSALAILKYLQSFELNVTAAKDGCKRADAYSTKSIVDNSCANDGYTMYRCPRYADATMS